MRPQDRTILTTQ